MVFIATSAEDCAVDSARMMVVRGILVGRRWRALAGVRMAVTIDDRCQPGRMVVAIANKHRRSRHRLHGQRQQNKDGSEGFEAFRHDKKYRTLEKSSIRDVVIPAAYLLIHWWRWAAPGRWFASSRQPMT
jgi:hypothetical protein